MIVVDASVYAFSLLDEGAMGERCRSALRSDARWISPEHWLVEVVSVIRGNLLGGKISQRHADDALDALARLNPVTPRTRVLLARMWALRGNFTSYDAAYIAAAQVYGCVLLTADKRMARAAPANCAIRVP